MKVTKLFSEFVDSEKTGGLLLLFVTLISLLLANASFGWEYVSFWHQKIGSHSIVEWINDGLMAVFFLLIGLELEREIYIGELSKLKNATLPIFGALGGMLVPATIYTLINMGTPAQSGAGIPMATDIAFAVGVLTLIGRRVPVSLKVFLTALAVIDDLGAILVIAFFYTTTISFKYLGLAMSIWIGLIILNRLKVKSVLPYLAGGLAMWYFMMQSGVHATITGVLVAFAIPFQDGSKSSTSYQLQHRLHKPVAFVILPLFALANTCIILGSNLMTGLALPASKGIILGLVVGKPLGIWLFSILSYKVGWCALPADLKWKHILGAGFLGGIGFTMSIFITLLAFTEGHYIDQSKIAILLSSLLAAITGFLFLNFNLRKQKKRHK